MTEQDFEFDYTDIEGSEGWKKEVHRLLKEVHRLETEVRGSQLMTGLILEQVGAVEVQKSSIANGLQGHGINLEEKDDSFIFSLEETNAN